MFAKGPFTPIGLDIRAHTLHAVQLRRCRDGLRPHAWGSVAVPPEVEGDGRNFRIEAIRHLLSQHDFQGNRVVGAIPSAQVDIRPVEIPFRNGTSDRQDQLRTDDLRPFLPYPLEAAVFDFLPFSATQAAKGERVKGLLVATKKEVANRSLAVLRATGLVCDGLDIRATAIGRTLGQHKNQACIIDLGDSTTEIMLRRESELCFTRTIRMGLSDILAAIEDVMALERSDALRLLRRYSLGLEKTSPVALPRIHESGLLDPGTASEKLFSVVEPVLESLTHELEHTFAYVGTHDYAPPVEHITLLGGLLPTRLDEYFSKKLDKSVCRVTDRDISAAWHIDDSFPLNQLATAAGLAMRGSDI